MESNPQPFTAASQSPLKQIINYLAEMKGIHARVPKREKMVFHCRTSLKLAVSDVIPTLFQNGCVIFHRGPVQHNLLLMKLEPHMWVSECQTVLDEDDRSPPCDGRVRVEKLEGKNKRAVSHKVPR